ncbi:hypothetical protein [Chryseobacterium sp. Leaf394]|uniref:hypothetical protein n=1 Tax=Chryseobacterium sp. Leaf394 TaxID=1736361 RepID=UPI0007007293|nr:hypothetical protein [Chryseobacterium sp. Leaf394]KQS90020.1 hypothetical protein ASG21_13720 [Chryseobacterium sp. Leaf394]
MLNDSKNILKLCSVKTSFFVDQSFSIPFVDLHSALPLSSRRDLNVVLVMLCGEFRIDIFFLLKIIVTTKNNTLAAMETASFFVADGTEWRPVQKRYSGQRETAPEKIRVLLAQFIFRGT